MAGMPVCFVSVGQRGGHLLFQSAANAFAGNAGFPLPHPCTPAHEATSVTVPQ